MYFAMDYQNRCACPCAYKYVCGDDDVLLNGFITSDAFELELFVVATTASFDWTTGTPALWTCFNDHDMYIRARTLGVSIGRRSGRKCLSIHVLSSCRENTLRTTTTTTLTTMRSFSEDVSPPPQTVPRRRKRGTSTAAADGEGNRQTNAPNAVTDLLPFVLASQTFLDKIEFSLMAMAEVNRDNMFVIQRSPSKLTLTLAPEHGIYTFEILEEQRLIRFVSPLSGGFSYVCDSDTGEWGGAEDGHRPEGILVRDLVRQVNGLPKL